jgi:hypothetical protein
MRRLLLLTFFCSSSFYVFSQTTTGGGPTPAQTLRLARATYEQGRLHEVPSQLNDDVLTKMTSSEKVSAYTLLCLSYIYLEEAEKADESMLNILLSDPYFKPDPAVDPAEFVALYNTFRTYPIYRIGAKLGVNASRPNVIESVTAVDAESGGGYKPLIAFQFGASADMPLYFLSKKLTLHADAAFQLKKFEVDITVDRGETFKNEFNGIETQSWLSLPITIEYELFDLKFHPYIALGASADLLLKSSITSERQRDEQASIEPKSFEPVREKMNISAIAAAGVKLPLSGGFLVFEVRYVYGLSNVTNKESAFANPKYTLDYGYADSIFKMNSLAVTGSYIINIFNPKKLKRK